MTSGIRSSQVGSRELEYDAVELSRVLAEVITNLSSVMEQTKAMVTSSSLPTVNANRSLMLQLFQNLIENGLKYNKEESAPRKDKSTERGSLR